MRIATGSRNWSAASSITTGQPSVRKTKPNLDRRAIASTCPAHRLGLTMLLARPLAQRRVTLLALAGALLLCAFIALPQGQAFASALLLLVRGQTIQPVT